MLYLSEDAILSNCITKVTCVFCRIEALSAHTHTYIFNSMQILLEKFGIVYFRSVNVTSLNSIWKRIMLRFYNSHPRNKSIVRLGLLAPEPFLCHIHLMLLHHRHRDNFQKLPLSYHLNSAIKIGM